MQDHIQVIIQLTESNLQPVKVRVKPSVVMQQFINDVCKRYGLNADEITVSMQNNAGIVLPITPTLTLGQNHIVNDTQLIFAPKTASKSPTRELLLLNRIVPLASTVFVSLQDETTGKQYRVSWQPAVIGRRDDKNPDKNKMLAVDLSTVKGAEFISRRHACIVYANGQYYVESINEQNPTYLEDVRLTAWQRKPIHPGDRIRVGKTTLIFKLLE